MKTIGAQQISSERKVQCRREKKLAYSMITTPKTACSQNRRASTLQIEKQQFQKQQKQILNVLLSKNNGIKFFQSIPSMQYHNQAKKKNKLNMSDPLSSLSFSLGKRYSKGYTSNTNSQSQQRYCLLERGKEKKDDVCIFVKKKFKRKDEISKKMKMYRQCFESNNYIIQK